MPDPHERFHQFLYAIILAQFVIIIGLLSGLSNEYISNAYMQTWINTNAPLLGVLLHGELDTAFVGAAIAITFLLIQRRRDVSRSPAPKAPTASTPIANGPITGNTPTILTPAGAIPPNPNIDPPEKTRKKPAEELPEHVLAELEKTDS